MNIVLTNSNDITRWADRYSSPPEMAVMIRQLIQATDRECQVIGFRDEKGVNLEGWDGIAEQGAGIGKVPKGTSYWELSTAGDSVGKLEADYNRRLKTPLGAEQSESTLVMVSLRRITGKDEWVAEKRKKKEWKDVRVYDADDLAGWLEQFIHIHVAVSRMLGKAPREVRDLESEWQDWSTATRDPIPSELLLAGREEEQGQLTTWLQGPPRVFTLQAESASEAIAFLAACTLAVDSDERDKIMMRCLIVDNRDAWLELAERQESMVLIARFDPLEHPHRAAANGHHVLIPVGLGQSSSCDLKLPRLSLEGLRKAMEKANSSGRVAERAQEIRNSLQAYRRNNAVVPGTLRPEWATAEGVLDLLPALFMCQWNEDVPGDCDVMGRLAGKSWEEVKRGLEKYLNMPDPPLRRTGSIWRICSHRDMWALFADFIDNKKLKTFSEIAIDVLAELDPRVGLSETKRISAELKGESLSLSAIARVGISKTLALMGSLSDETDTSRPLATSYAEGTIRRLFDKGKPWQFWASLDRTLLYFAEAAPSELLEAINRDLRKKDSDLTQIFVESDGFVMGHSWHNYLLWALEIVAWNPDYLGGAAQALAALHQVDRGGSTSNRPLDSLVRIFLLWHPCTSAGAGQRLEVLGGLRKSYPEVSWLLSKALLPQHFGNTHSTAQPDYRDWIPDDPHSVTTAEMVEATDQIVSWMIEDAGTDGHRWAILVDHLFLLTEASFNCVMGKLEELSVADLPDTDRALMWRELKREMSRDKEEDENNKMPKDVRKRIKELIQKLEPRDPRLLHAWIFDHEAYFELYRKAGDRANVDQQLLDLAITGADAIFAFGGMDAIVETAREVKRPDLVGIALGRSKMSTYGEVGTLARLLASDEPNLKSLANGLIVGRVQVHGGEWLDRLVKSQETTAWLPEQRGDLYFRMGFTRETWVKLELEPVPVQDAYWNLVAAWPASALPVDDLEYATTKLEAKARYSSAIDMVNWQRHHRGEPLQPTRLVELLMIAATTKSEESLDRTLLHHGITELIEELETSGKVEKAVIGRLQYIYLSFFTSYHKKPYALFEVLGEDPKLYVELLSTIFRAKGEEKRKLTKQEKALGSHIWRLFHEWSLPPGVSRDGAVDPERLKSWVHEVRSLAAEVNRSAIADSQMGAVLAYYPVGNDGAWPHESLRDLLEEVASSELDTGLSFGVRNTRGVTSRGMFDGGAQERDLRNKYRGYADKTKGKWPRITSVLLEVADSYLSDADRHDAHAELTQDGLN